ncbi:TadE/TadG family type IV pilus assembly protein [Streptomyces sp. TR06-5]|uniref:TadE/TadG family type IV pilus assembly protein n=1 Tax=unclassified Streptomyces TaxID=2593676 RepID=UPI0039A14AE9
MTHPHSRRFRDQRGQASIEFLGFLPILLALALASVQLGLAVYASLQAGTAARAAARTASHSAPRIGYDRAGRAAMSDWLADDTTFTRSAAGDGVTVTARVTIPSVVPGVDFGHAEKSSTMPRD